MRNLVYSDKTQAQILKAVEKWGEACTKLVAFAELPPYAREEFDTVIFCIAEMMYNYHLQTPENWTAAALEDILTNIFPRKTIVSESFYKAVDPAFTFFVDYLCLIEILSEKKALLLKRRMKKSVPVMQRRADEAVGFSPIKKLLMEGIEQGLDVTDIDALNSYLESRNLIAPPPKKGGAKRKRGTGKKSKNSCAMKTIEDAAPIDLPDSGAEEYAEPSLEQWKQLYEIAEILKRTAPWEKLRDSNLITLVLPGMEEPICCCTLGGGGEYRGISIYPGYKSIAEFYRMAQSPPDEPPFISLFRQDCLTCNFGSRDELLSKDRQVIKALELRFRGKNQWIYFRSMRPGFYPWFINAKQADLLIRALRSYAQIYSYFADGVLVPDFAAGETLLRFYSEEKKCWVNDVSGLPTIPEADRYLAITDELLIARLNKKKKTTAQLEFDLFCIPTPIQEKDEDIPYLPRVALLVNHKKGRILDKYMAKPDDYAEDIVLNLFRDYVIKHGRPASIRVRSEEMRLMLQDICEKTDVTLIGNQNLPEINALLNGLMEMMEEDS